MALTPPSLLLLDRIQEMGNLCHVDTNTETENIVACLIVSEHLFFSLGVLFLFTSFIIIIMIRIIIVALSFNTFSIFLCHPLSLSLQALKALQEMSLSSPCSPPPLSMRHSKAIPVQAFEVQTHARIFICGYLIAG